MDPLCCLSSGHPSLLKTTTATTSTACPPYESTSTSFGNISPLHRAFPSGSSFGVPVSEDRSSSSLDLHQQNKQNMRNTTFPYCDYLSYSNQFNDEGSSFPSSHNALVNGGLQRSFGQMFSGDVNDNVDNNTYHSTNSPPFFSCGNEDKSDHSFTQHDDAQRKHLQILPLVLDSMERSRLEVPEPPARPDSNSSAMSVSFIWPEPNASKEFKQLSPDAEEVITFNNRKMSVTEMDTCGSEENKFCYREGLQLRGRMLEDGLSKESFIPSIEKTILSPSLEKNTSKVKNGTGQHKNKLDSFFSRIFPGTTKLNKKKPQSVLDIIPTGSSSHSSEPLSPTTPPSGKLSNSSSTSKQSTSARWSKHRKSSHNRSKHRRRRKHTNSSSSSTTTAA